MTYRQLAKAVKLARRLEIIVERIQHNLDHGKPENKPRLYADLEWAQADLDREVVW